MNSIEETILQVNEYLFCYDINNAQAGILLLVDKISSLAEQIGQDRIVHLNQILQLLDLGMRNRDYLFLSDVLEFEMLPYIRSINSNLLGGN